MPNTATITGSVGPNQTMTAQVFNNVSSANFDFNGQTVTINSGRGQTIVDLYGITTVTYTISNHLATITLS